VSTENAAFCTKFMEADAAVNQLQSGSGSPDATNTALADAQKAAPAALTDTVDSLVTGMKTFLASPEAQQSQNGPPDDVTNSYYDVVKWMSGNCGYQDVAVKAQEYKYIGMPESLDAGPTLVSLTNEGSEFHEVVIIKKKPGTTETAEEIIALVDGTKSTIVHEPLPEDDPKRRRPDITKAQTILGWNPVVDRAEGLARTLEYFRTVV